MDMTMTTVLEGVYQHRKIELEEKVAQKTKKHQADMAIKLTFTTWQEFQLTK
jgi:hypothetical protein